MDIRFRRDDKIVKQAYSRKRYKETPMVRDVKVVWHVGLSGSGKSYTMQKILLEHGEDYLYLVSDYENGWLDNYECQPVLFLDEYRGQWKYSFLLTVLDVYKRSYHARYANVIGLWNEVHITSVKTPDMVYENMITDEAERGVETFEQLRRRITHIVYHWKDENGYHSYEMPMDLYKGYPDLMQRALYENFRTLPSGVNTPFD